MRTFLYLEVIGFVFIFAVLTGCQIISNDSGGSTPERGYWPSNKEKAMWVRKCRLVEATAEEIAIARNGEVPFIDMKASISDGALTVVFKMGALQTYMGPENFPLCTTTSVYEVNNPKSGTTLAKTASTLSVRMADELGYKQKIWVSQDHNRLLIYETWCDGCGSHDTYALVSKSPNGANWQVRYLKLPEFTGYPGVNDHGPVPVGFAGDYLIFNPLVSDRNYKKKLADMEEAKPPLPFTIG